MPGHLAIGYRLRRLLQLENLEVDTATLVGHDEEWVHRALGSACLVSGRKSKTNISFLKPPEHGLGINMGTN